MTIETPPASPGQRGRVLGMTAQTAGVVGIVVSLLMIIVVILGRGWAVDRVDTVALRAGRGRGEAHGPARRRGGDGG